jgi:hypothetical protein
VFLLFGTSPSERIVNVVAFVCGFCHTNARQNVVKSSNRFTLFFVPLFSFSTRYYNECTNCAGRTALTKAQVDHSLSSPARTAP